MPSYVSVRTVPNPPVTAAFTDDQIPWPYPTTATSPGRLFPRRPSASLHLLLMKLRQTHQGKQLGKVNQVQQHR